jgi:hemerythrin superfamily protein
MLNSLSGKSQPDDAVALLKADHRKVEGLFKTFEQSESADEKKELLRTIIQELTVHSLAEEQLVYPIIEERAQDKAYEAEEEHHVVEMLLSELSRANEPNEKICAKVKVLSELVQHHVKEEEGELLPILEKSGTDLTALGEQIQQRKEQLMKDAMKLAEGFLPSVSQKPASVKDSDSEKPIVTKRRANSRKATTSRHRGGETKKSSTQKRKSSSTKANVRSIKSAKDSSPKSQASAKPGRTTTKAASASSRKTASGKGSKSRSSNSGRSRKAS